MAKTQKEPHANAKVLVRSIIRSPETFDLGNDPRAQLLAIAKYAAALEVVEAQSALETTAVNRSSDAQLQELVETLRRTVKSQIQNMMVVSKEQSHNGIVASYMFALTRRSVHSTQWKASCKEGKAKWMYEGVSPDTGECTVTFTVPFIRT